MSITIIKQKHPLRRNGSRRIDRMIQALTPTHFKLDDHTMQDLLVAAHRYSKMLSWFNADDRPDGDWTCFWEAETLTYLAVLAATDLENLRKTYDDADFDLGIALESKMPAAKKNVLVQEKYRALLEVLFGMAKGLEERYRKLVAIRHPLQHALLKLIKKDNIRDTEEIAGTMIQLIGLHKGKDDTLAPDKYDLFIHPDGRWGMKEREDYGRILAEAPSNTTREQLRSIFIRFYNTYVVLQHAAQRAFDEELALMEKPENEVYRIVQPHISLFIAFLRLFKHAQDSLNELVGKQLDFYYEQVLGLRRAPAVPDSVYLIFTLAKNFDPQMVEKGTLLFGGKDKLGPRMYETIQDWVVSQAKLEEVKSFYLPDAIHTFIDELSTAPKLNYKTVIGNNYTLPFSDGGIRTFSDHIDLLEEEVGFVLASPQLLLQEGKRLIELKITNTPAIFVSENIRVYVSTEEEWAEVPLSAAPISQSVTNSLESLTISAGFNIVPDILKVYLPKDFPPLVQIKENGVSKKWPAIKIVWKKEKLSALTGGYAALINNTDKIFTVSVRAEGVSKNLILQNDTGVYDGTQQMMPFGPSAPKGARFYVGFAEALMKKANSIQLKPNWLNPLSNSDLDTYYSVYNANTANDLSRTIIAEILDGNVFHTIGGLTSISFVNDGTSLSPINNSISTRDTTADTTFKGYDPSIKRGFIRVIFEGELGHTEFPNILAFLSDGPASAAALPNPPYTPMFNSIELDYYSVDQPMLQGVDEFFYIHPFNGFELVKNELPSGTPTEDVLASLFGTKVELFKNFLFKEHENINRFGHLYLGFSQLQPNSNISLLIQTGQGTERRTDKNAPKLEWYCLTKSNTWQPIPADKILSDSTHSLTRSGIIQIAVPDSLSSEDNTILTPTLTWLKVAALEDSDTTIAALPNLTYIHAQAIEARFLDQGFSDYEHLVEGLPANSISKLAISRSSIKKMEQPFISFNGRKPESEGMAFYMRISEWLRHRDRAVTVWDYEHLILEAFADVAAVKCIPHAQYFKTPNSEIAPGFVAVSVIPDVAKRSGVSLLEPRFPKGDLDEMRDFLLSRNTVFLNDDIEPGLSVINAQYERIQIDVSVRFRYGVDVPYHLIKLNQDLIYYLSPWRNNGTAPGYGAMLRRSQIIQFIESLNYIDFVDLPSFSIKKDGYNSGEYIRPAAAHGVLCSDIEHNISEF